MKRYFLLLIMVSLSVVAWADKWKVIEDNVTIWDSPECSFEMGHLQKDKVINVRQVKGDWLLFSYLGDDACVSKSACEEYVEKAPVEEVKPKADEEKNTIQEVAVVKDVPVDTQQASPSQEKEEISENPKWLLIIMLLIALPIVLVISVVYLVALVFAAFYVFKYDKLRSWFNKKCGIECIPKSRLNSILKMSLRVAFMGFVPYAIARFGTDWISNATIRGVVQLVMFVLMVIIPYIKLKLEYKRYSATLGKKAAKWVLIYGLLSIVAIYLTAVLVFALICLVAILYVLCVVLDQTTPGGALEPFGRKCSNCDKFGSSSCPHQESASSNSCCSSHSW